jgi:hypothetical protein
VSDGNETNDETVSDDGDEMREVVQRGLWFE